MNTILVIDDDLSISRLIEYHLKKENYQVFRAASGEEGLEILNSNSVQIVLQDVYLPGIGGTELLTEIKQNHPEIPVIMITASNSVDLAVNAVKIGAFDFLAKPIDLDRMKIGIRNALKNMELHNQLHNLETQISDLHSFENIIGNSIPMKQVYSLIDKVANNDIPVLIQGESGTGKELVARAIHNHGNRQKTKFVDVNCAAFPETLLESELFGHEKGAFTDANCRHIGKFELAGNGTLFLDEIGEMPISIQAKILRVLQEKTIVRVGGSESIPINCRILTATNKNLKKELNAGKFREDLYYRISVFPITLPTLRERFEDILLLVPHFLKKYAAKNTHKTVPIKVMKTLLNYKWPGNVRELENTIYRATILAGDKEISLENLPSEIRFKRSSDCENNFSDFLGKKIIPFETIEREIYKHALQIEQGNISNAAKKLGIGRTTFYRKLKKYNLSE